MEEINEKPKRAKKQKSECPNTTGAGVPSIYQDRKSLFNFQGYVEGIEYKHDKYGFISWKEMIPEEFIVLNRAAYEAEGKDITLFNEEALQDEIKNAPENKKLIKLGGFKYLARLRGIKSQTYSLAFRNNEMASVSCEIEFTPNSENIFGLKMSTLAQASLENVNGEYAKYLDVIASNRAFIRCVREALNILILGQDEIPEDKGRVTALKPGSPLDLIKKKVTEKSIDFAKLLSMLSASDISVKDEWVNLDSLPTPIILTALKLIKEHE